MGKYDGTETQFERTTIQRLQLMGFQYLPARIGVIWHTTGSGKSLSMTFLVAILSPGQTSGQMPGGCR